MNLKFHSIFKKNQKKCRCSEKAPASIFFYASNFLYSHVVR